MRTPSTIENRLLEGVYWMLVACAVAGVLVGFACGAMWLVGLACGALMVGLWAGFIEPRLLTQKTIRLNLAASPRAVLRVAFLSDFHAGFVKSSAFYRRVVQRTLALHPDVVILGGDFVEASVEGMRDLECLRELAAPLGVHFLLGNHDFLDDPVRVQRTLAEFGCVDATNRVWVLEKEGAVLEVVSLEDAYFGTPNLALLKSPRRGPRLLLLHEPDQLLDVEEGTADLILFGHTHGGQVRLPFIGAVHPLPQIVSRQFDRGVRSWRGIPVVIGQGLGESTGRVRFCCPPQLLLLEIGLG